MQHQLGLAAKCAGDLSLAEEAFRTAMRHAPDEGEPIAELALLLTETDRWDEAKALMAGLHPDMPDVRAMLRPCTPLAQAALQRAIPALRDLDDDNPDPALLDEAAPWIDLALDMYAITARGYSKGPAEFSELVAGMLDALHKVIAPDGSPFAQVIHRFDALMTEWRSAPA